MDILYVYTYILTIDTSVVLSNNIDTQTLSNTIKYKYIVKYYRIYIHISLWKKIKNMNTHKSIFHLNKYQYIYIIIKI